MKRVILALGLACITVASTTPTRGEAQSTPQMEIFPGVASCNEQALRDLPRHLKPEGVSIAEYIDKESPAARKAARIDVAFFRLTEEAWNLLEASQFGKLTPRVTKPASVRAYWILQKQFKVRLPEELTQPIWNDDAGTIVYQCFSDTCPAGSTCSAVGGPERAEKIAQAITSQRRFVTKTLSWAKDANRPLSERRALRENYRRNENALRELLKDPPNEIFRSTTTVKRK